MQGTTAKKKGFSILDAIEKVGNKLPHPYILFLWLCLILAVISCICSLAGVSVVNPTTGDTVVANSLLSKDGLVWLLQNMLSNFQSFAPLGLVLAMQMAIGFAESAGVLTTALRKAILGVPLWALTGTVLFLGINGSIASEASIIVVPALAAVAFETVGMHPIAGLLAGYAATNAGFTVCVIIAGTDVLLAGVTQEAAQLIDPAVTVGATANWYFMIVSVFVLTIAGVFVNKKFIAPRLGTYHPNGVVDNAQDKEQLTPEQRKGLRAAGFTGIPLMLFFIILCCIVNLFMTSGTAKWYIFAPILVPMMMMLGYSPEFAQVIYRIGDSTTNAITPIYPYIPIAIGMAKKYDKDFGMGSLISMMLPYAIAFLLVWIIQLIVWVVFKLPLGPGATVFL